MLSARGRVGQVRAGVRGRGLGLLVCGLATLGACDRGPAEPEDAANRVIAIFAGNGQFGVPGQPLADPLEVVVRDAASQEWVEGVAVSWRVVDGSGALVLPLSSRTDTLGVARAQLRLGSQTGVYRVEARISSGAIRTAVFEARAVLVPEVLAVTPAAVSAGETVTITGKNFSPRPEDNTVLFGGLPGTVVEATPTELKVVVPACLPDRTDLPVTVQLGAVASPQAALLSVAGGAHATVRLGVGEAQTFAPESGLLCAQLPADQPGALYLVVPQNVYDLPGRTLPYTLLGRIGEAPPVIAVAGQELASGESGADEAAIAWEGWLRERERGIEAEALVQPGPVGALRPFAATFRVGDRREFNVINKDEKFTRVTAQVVAVSDRAVFFQDVNAPPGGFSAEDFAQLGRFFDDAIYSTVVSAFGEPSDIDGNGKVIILFTPVVNRMTPPNSKESGVIAGFFYGFDLTGQQNSNRAEIFYSLVPDPEGKFGNRLARDEVLRHVPPVLAHELQHMVAFNQRVLLRNAKSEALWLSEGLAHMAEDLVANVLASRGDGVAAANFRSSNLQRARRFLTNTEETSLLTNQAPGTLAERGAGWLFVKYVADHYGGDGLLRRLTQTVRTGVENVSAETGVEWDSLFSDWSIALWADDAPELSRVTVEPRFTFPTINLRTDLALYGAFPLVPPRLAYQDFEVKGGLAAGAASHFTVRVPLTATARPLTLGLVGTGGMPFPAERRPQLTVFRIQ
mgnify:CR=1 FL=1